MAVIAFVSHCPNAGRTTLACNMAMEAEGAQTGGVTLIDTTPDAALAAWGDKHGSSVHVASADSLAYVLPRVSGDGAHILIDTPPAPAAQLEPVIAQADLIVIPALAGGEDANQIASTVELVERLGKPFLFVVNRGDPREPLTTEAAMALAQHGTLCPIALTRSVAVARCLKSGTSIARTDADVARTVREIWHYVLRRLGVSAGEPIPASPPPVSVSNVRAAAQAAEITLDVALFGDGTESLCSLDDISGDGVTIGTTVALQIGDLVNIHIAHFGRFKTRVSEIADGRARLAFLAEPKLRARIGMIVRRCKVLSDMIGQGLAGWQVSDQAEPWSKVAA